VYGGPKSVQAVSPFLDVRVAERAPVDAHFFFV
jgi:hypothetical protein